MPVKLETFDTPVSYGGLVSVLVTRDVFVEVGEAAGRRLSDVAELVPGHHVGLQVVCERALVVEASQRGQRVNIKHSWHARLPW